MRATSQGDVAMGDISAEPSMEDILSSIKRIIAEEGEPARPRRSMGSPRGAALPPRTAAPHHFADADRDDAVLELNDPITPDEPEPEPEQRAEAEPEPAPMPTPTSSSRASTREAQPAAAPTPDRAKVSAATVEAARDALDSLSRLVVRPEQPGSDTLEGMVRDMLRPMLAQWLDQHLPALVEQMVAREIARITDAEM